MSAFIPGYCDRYLSLINVPKALPPPSNSPTGNNVKTVKTTLSRHPHTKLHMGKLRICRLGVVGAHGERIFLLGNISETNFCLFQPEADRSLGHLTRVTIATGPHTCILMALSHPAKIHLNYIFQLLLCPQFLLSSLYLNLQT